MSIPKNEMNLIANSIARFPEYLDPKYISSIYQYLGLEVISDPSSIEISSHIIEAIKNKKPFSVIRLGDGEANLLSYAAYPETPILNLVVAKQIIAKQEDRFKVSPLELIKIQHRIFEAVLNADIVGLIGLWRPQKRTIHALIEAFQKDPRGISGHWRAIEHLIKLAKKGFLKEKTLAPAHLYLSILENFEDILNVSKKILLITNKTNVIKKLKTEFPSKIDYIINGKSNDHNKIEPEFLYHLEKQLPSNMSGYLCLIGAGPWSEIYCDWVKQRGGVGIDFGTGFDLLDGKTNRPIHKILKLDINNRFAL